MSMQYHINHLNIIEIALSIFQIFNLFFQNTAILNI